MSRQNTSPIEFSRSTRVDNMNGGTSMRGGKCYMLHTIPLLPGDSGSGRYTGRFDLAEMPRPLMNNVYVNIQAWYVSKAAHPQFAGYDEFLASRRESLIKTLGATDRVAPKYYPVFSLAQSQVYSDSLMAKTLGHHDPDEVKNVDHVTAYNLVYNYRASAHSNKIPLKDYPAASMTNAVALARAFWPTDGQFGAVVPDYERALVVGSFDLDVQAGLLPVVGIGTTGAAGDTSASAVKQTNRSATVSFPTGWTDAVIREDADNPGYPKILAELGDSEVVTSLAQMDKARMVQAFAKMAASYAGLGYSGFDNETAMMAELMQGLTVPEDYIREPILLDSKRVPFGMVERHATDSGNLDASVTKGSASVALSLNVPQQSTGGDIVIIAEILPERLHERQGDPYLRLSSPSHLPDALRDIQNPEPVDLVENWRIDSRHTTPDDLYGYEPQNNKWNRNFTRLGGVFYQENPLLPFQESRSGLWQPNVVDPEFTDDHYLAPSNLTHNVFADTTADAAEISHACSFVVRGLTQIGDVLVENTDTYSDVKENL